MVYLPHVDETAETSEPFYKGYAESPRPVFLVSVRGLGESRPATCDNTDYFAPYEAEFFYACHANMMGTSLTGGRVYDLLRVIQLLEANGYTSIELCGRGMGGLIALYAAPFAPVVKTLRLRNTLPAFGDMVRSDRHKWPHGVLVPGLLNLCDLPDITAHLKAGGCAVDIAEPWDAMMQPVPPKT